MYIECMLKILKQATVEQAKQALDQNSFVYNNPCCKCQKQCSTPTKDIWMRRINEFGGVQQMYAQYKCRKCRKHNDADVQLKAPEPAIACTSIAKDPMVHYANASPMMKKKEQRPLIQIKPDKVEAPPMQPGEHVEHKPGHFAFSVWEDGIHKGTTWYKYNDKAVD